MRFVIQCFHFLYEEFDFQLSRTTNREGLFYDVEYKRNNTIISISYENREDYFQTILFIIKNGIMPDYDDKTSTIHLPVLVSKFFSELAPNDFEENNKFFSLIKTSTEIEKKILKSAKELRICLSRRFFILC